MRDQKISELLESRHLTQALLGTLLRVGVIAAALIVAGGGFAYLLEYWHQLPNLSTFGGEPAELTRIPDIFRLALTGHSQALIQAGLLVLIFTPIMRVVFSVFLFALERDWLYVGITIAVLGLLMYSLLGDSTL